MDDWQYLVTPGLLHNYEYRRKPPSRMGDIVLGIMSILGELGCGYGVHLWILKHTFLGGDPELVMPGPEAYYGVQEKKGKEVHE